MIMVIIGTMIVSVSHWWLLRHKHNDGVLSTRSYDNLKFD